MYHKPQTEGDTLLATTSMTPCPISPPFNRTKASCAMLNPTPAASTAVKLIDTLVAGLVRLQHPPQLGEFHTTSNAPPMKGNVGTSPNVGKRATKPFAPFEHATLFSEPFLLSYVASNVARRVGAGALGLLGFECGFVG